MLSQSTNRPSSLRPVAPHAWSAVGAMTLCVAMLIASEFMPVSLLTPIAADLRASGLVAGENVLAPRTT